MLFVRRSLFPITAAQMQVVKLTKVGPSTPVTSGQSFTFELRARFESGGPFTDAVIVDDLPAGLLPGAGLATWVGSKNGTGRVNGCESLMQKPHTAKWLGSIHGHRRCCGVSCINGCHWHA
jgi:hypothetical protein